MPRYTLSLIAALLSGASLAAPTQPAVPPPAAQPYPQAPSPADLEQLNRAFFEEFDSNRDGQVTREEFLAPSVARFKFLDRNDDGRIEMQEVADFTHMMTQPPIAPR
jgi:hypothetical protein